MAAILNQFCKQSLVYIWMLSQSTFQTVSGDKYGVGLIPGWKQTEAGWNQTPREKQKIWFMSRLLKRNRLKIVGTKIRSRCGEELKWWHQNSTGRCSATDRHFVANKVEIYLLTRFMKTLRSPSYRNPQTWFYSCRNCVKSLKCLITDWNIF